MKKRSRISIVLVLALAMTLVMAGTVLASDPTELKMEWNGAGYVGTTFTAGDDAVVDFSTSGAAIRGIFTAEDFNNADKGGYYNVDKVSSQIDAYVADGFISFEHDRTASLSKYGPAGQTSYSYLSALGGWGELKYSGSQSDMAKLVDYHPGVGSPYTARQFKVDASQYVIQRTMSSNDAWATVWAFGSGTAELGAGYSRASGWGGTPYVDDYNMASLTRLAAFPGDCAFSAKHDPLGYYDFSKFQVFGGGTKSVTFPAVLVGGVPLTATGNGVNPITLGIIAEFSDAFTIGDYSVTAVSQVPSP